MLRRIMLGGLLWLTVAPVMAGALKDGAWVPSGCEKTMDPTVVDTTSADSYNASVKALNAWQQTAQAYDDCVVKEANADAALIAESVKVGQGKVKELMTKINKQLDDGRALLQQRGVGK